MGKGRQINMEKWMELGAEVYKSKNTGPIEIDTKDGGLISAEFKIITRRKINLSGARHET